MVDDSIYTVLDREFWSSIDQKRPGSELRAVVEAVLATERWSVIPGGVWTHVQPPGWRAVAQGWKLHVSATPGNASAVLEAVARVLKEDRAGFKFSSDLQVLGVMLSKNWPREAGGKFITVYPSSDEHFQRLARLLAAATEGFEGPYILSDRRVPGARIVFYRYGGHEAFGGVDARGSRESHVLAPSGEAESDHRRGWYQPPAWSADPYGARPVRVLKDSGASVTLRERYLVERAIKFSNMGGVYRARDLLRDRPVVIRERRPFTGWVDAETDAIGLLRKEARILRTMDGSGWTPGYVDEFQAWEHRYLVMEEVPGPILRDHALAGYFGRHGVASPRRVFARLHGLVNGLVTGLEEFHRRGIVVRDLSAGNVIVRPDGSLCFIDLEYAWERGGDQAYAPGIHTPGYAPAEQVAGVEPSEADDFHALGAVVVELCSMLAPGLGLNREGTLAAAAMAMNEVGLPEGLLEIARGLLDPDPSRRWRGTDVRRALGALSERSLPRTQRRISAAAEPVDADSDAAVTAGAAAVCEELCRFFEAAADPEATDCLFPAPPEAYRLNPVSIQFGACGPIEFVRRMRGGCPEPWLEWVERRARPELCPPGLYAGLSGVAVTLAGCGRNEAAARLMDQAIARPLLPEHPSLYLGAAGVGVAALALAGPLNRPDLLDWAANVGDELERSAERSPRGLAWRAADRSTPCGLAMGGSGIALFYTYLGACTGKERYWHSARQALDFELAQVSRSAGLDFWPAAVVRGRKVYRSPHVSFGTAGVATAALRLYACTRDPVLSAWTERCAQVLGFRWTNKLWQDMGLAGWGETLLDDAAATGSDRYRHAAVRIAENLLAMRVQTRLGTAFPGGGLNRVSSDYGSGASGIGLFLHRLATPGATRAFYPDHLLPGLAAGEAVSAAEPPQASVSAPGTSGEAAARRPAGRGPGRARARTPA
jgi:tRNA A-37 threonylcarbamoyl transferase component Bud32